MAEKKEGKSRTSRRRKSGKYAPLLWVATGAAIALFIAYSGALKDKFFPAGQKTAQIHSSALAVGSLSPVSSFAVSVSSAVITQTVPPATQTVVTLPPATNAAPSDSIIVKLYLAKQKGNEVVLVERPVRIQRGASVLKDTLNALIQYRQESDLLNLIPLQSVVRDVRIRNGVAQIDFNDAFQYNTYGVTGYTVQIYQVVHTATQFSSVKAVTFLVNGRVLRALGGEGYMVANPVYPYSSLPHFPL
jgi:spore germination protein GerM